MSTDADVAITAALAGAAEVRSRYGAPVTRHSKGGIDFATEADLAAEHAVRAVVRAARPDDAFVGEEEGLQGDPDAVRRWLVDPLCGTLNFAAGTPGIGVNVALLVAGEPGPAAVADPLTGEAFWTDGTGAWVRGVDGTDAPLVPSADSRLVDVDVDHERAWAAAVLASPGLASYAFRGFSTSLALVWVAAGRRAAYLQAGDLRGSVHFAAPLAICRAAGVVLSGLAGQPVLADAGGLVAAADRTTHARMLDIVSEA
ncbi:inositol monophosphatase family protein [Nocardioides lianchengensis]|uniref:Myo-inositol-1(Or 4)-monophosphatase n=1 Tax=Nocardioides lianchengensis TaxID=1045774 RepID=A0A1G6Q5B6_9ACTN|nr:inositol monophosphatase family protein [Nocardioides lianchengensis]NYG12104.1 myo-inositol-1(or 4)-monophosphatase [Nocardioides lianchengensis]SDC87650.1 myo-inositol-1(or 4)-monophosphatase [Nocardioides lianchengensis]